MRNYFSPKSMQFILPLAITLSGRKFASRLLVGSRTSVDSQHPPSSFPVRGLPRYNKSVTPAPRNQLRPTLFLEGSLSFFFPVRLLGTVDPPISHTPCSSQVSVSPTCIPPFPPAFSSYKSGYVLELRRPLDPPTPRFMPQPPPLRPPHLIHTLAFTRFFRFSSPTHVHSKPTPDSLEVCLPWPALRFFSGTA